jgi:hypothetical protein
MYHRIRSCVTLAEGKCPHHVDFVKLYITPQLLRPEGRCKYERVLIDCLHCKRFKDFRFEETDSEAV